MRKPACAMLTLAKNTWPSVSHCPSDIPEDVNQECRLPPIADASFSHLWLTGKFFSYWVTTHEIVPSFQRTVVIDKTCGVGYVTSLVHDLTINPWT